GHRPERHRDRVIGGFADPGRAGRRLGHQDPEHVAADDEQDAEVKQRRAEPQQAALIQLAGPGGPAELVVAVAPDMAEHEYGDGHVRGDDPRRPPMYSGGANGSRPPSSAGGPVRASSSARCRSRGAASGRTPRTASMT